MQDVEGFDKRDYPLHSAALAEWEGFVFVNVATDPEPFEVAFAPMIGRLTRFGLARLAVGHRVTYEVNANWKLVFQEQRVPGTLQVWFEPFTNLRAPKLFNLRTDPLERADITSNTYWDWLLDRIFLMVPAQGIVAEFLGTFQAFPPRQKAASFTIDQVMAQLTQGAAGGD